MQIMHMQTLGSIQSKKSQWICDTLLLADVFENFGDKCNEIHELDPVYFVPAPGLAWQACLKKTGVKW